MSRSETKPDLTRQQAEEMYKDLSAAASRRRRRRTIVRVVGVAVSAVFILITLIWATAALSGLGHRTMVGSGNGEPTPNYRFEDVTVTGYVDPRTGEVDPGKAAILGTIRWTSDAYPGVHECTFTAFGPDGSTVGREQGEVSALSERSRTSMPISVSGAAVSGEITCDPMRLDTPVAYEIRDAHVASVLDPQSGELVGARVLYTVVWPEGVELPDYPGTNACTVRFARASGEPVAGWRFTLDAPPGRSETPEIGLSDLPGVTSLAEIDELTATVGCVPFTGDSNASPNGAGQETSDATPSDEAADLEAAVRSLFPRGHCVGADEATSLIQEKLAGLGLTDWSVAATAGASGESCVAAGFVATERRIVLVPASGPTVSAAMEGVAATLMNECLGKDQATELMSSVLTGIGQTSFTISTDGPLAYPEGQEEAVRAHIASGCFVYSATGWGPDGQPIYYISGSDA